MTGKEYYTLLNDISSKARDYNLATIKIPYYKMDVTLVEVLYWCSQYPVTMLIGGSVPKDCETEINNLSNFVNAYIDEHFPTHNPNEEWEHLTHLNKKWNFQKTYEVLCDGCANGFEFFISDGNLYMRERQ